jgi:hypothetical protein
MRILLLGSKSKNSLSSSYLRAFKDVGCEVSVFDFWGFYKNNFLTKNKIGHRLFWRILSIPLQSKIIEEIKNKNPHLVLVFKGWLIRPNTIKKIKIKFPKIKIFNFNPDNPFNTWHHGNSNNWIRDSIKFYDCCFIWGKFLIDKLYKLGAKKVEYLPFGYDPELHYPINVSNDENSKYGSDVSFIGSWDEEREEWLSHLLNYDLKIWGNAWEKASKGIQDKWQKKAVYGKDFSKICSNSKINLNFIRKQNKTSHNMRTFEIPACCGFMLTNETVEQKELLKNYTLVDYFKNKEDLIKKIDYFLKNKEKLNKNNYNLFLNENSYKNRAKKILKIYNNQNS